MTDCTHLRNISAFSVGHAVIGAQFGKKYISMYLFWYFLRIILCLSRCVNNVIEFAFLLRNMKIMSTRPKDLHCVRLTRDACANCSVS